MCTSSAATWTPALTFLAGAATAIFAEPLRRWIFRPAIEVSFEPDACVIDTPSEIRTANGQKIGDSRGWWIRVRVRTMNIWLKSRLTKGCRAYLTKVEIEEQGQFRPTNFVDSLRLKWSSQPADEAAKPIDIANEVSQFIDVLATDRNTPGKYGLQAVIVPFYCQHLFDERPKALRLTILVTSDDAKPTRTSFVFRWKGAWDTFETSQG